MILESGIKLGPYEILSPIGSGGMGEVWKARDTRLGRIVAIKKVKEQHSERFKQEARAIAALNHTFICQLFDIGPDYLILEYVDGKPLSSPLPEREAVRLAIQIGKLDEAVNEMEKVAQHLGFLPLIQAARGFVCARAGRIGDARKLLEELHKTAQQTSVPAICFAIVSFGLGEIDSAFNWFDEAADERHPLIFQLPFSPLFDSFHSHPRYRALLRKMNLAP